MLIFYYFCCSWVHECVYFTGTNIKQLEAPLPPCLHPGTPEIADHLVDLYSSYLLKLEKHSCILLFSSLFQLTYC